MKIFCFTTLSLNVLSCILIDLPTSIKNWDKDLTKRKDKSIGDNLLSNRNAYESPKVFSCRLKFFPVENEVLGPSSQPVRSRPVHRTRGGESGVDELSLHVHYKCSDCFLPISNIDFKITDNKNK